MDQEQKEIQNANETGTAGSEFSSYSEFDRIPGLQTVPETRSEPEFSEKDLTPKKKKEKSAQTYIHKLLTTATVVVAAVVTAETIGVIGMPDVTVREAYVETSESAVWYSVEVEGYSKDGDGLAAEVYNDFERHREPLQIEEYSNDYREEEQSPEEQNVRYAFGEVYGLKPDTDYTLEIFYGSWTVYKQKIRTAKQEEPWQDDPHEDPDTGDPTQASVSMESSESMIYYSGSLTNFRSDDVFVVRLFQNGDLYAQNQVTGLSTEEPYFAGEFYDLAPDTEYIIQLVKNPDTDSEQLVYEEVGRTQTEQPAVTEANWMQLEPVETSLVYAISLNNYQGGGAFTVQLFEDDEVVQESSFENISLDEPYLSGTFYELRYGTAYQIRLLMDGEILLTGSVFLEEPVEPVPEAEFDPTASTISYSVVLNDYNEGDEYRLVLTLGADEIDSRQFVDISPDQPYVSGEFIDLQPETEYTVQLLKNGEPVLEQSVITLQAEQIEDPEINAAWEEVEASDSDIAYLISLTNYREGVSFTVQLLKDNEVTAQEPYDDVSIDEPYLSGTFSNLEPDTDYILQLLQDGEAISVYRITTAQVQEQLPETNFTATENAISYLISLTDITEDDWYMVILMDATGESQRNEVSDVSADKPYTTGEFTDLQPGTEYTIQLMKNQEIVSEWTVFTQSADGQSTTGG